MYDAMPKMNESRGNYTGGPDTPMRFRHCIFSAKAAPPQPIAVYYRAIEST